jgi:hypothetical protein
MVPPPAVSFKRSGKTVATIKHKETQNTIVSFRRAEGPDVGALAYADWGLSPEAGVAERGRRNGPASSMQQCVAGV